MLLSALTDTLKDVEFFQISLAAKFRKASKTQNQPKIVLDAQSVAHYDNIVT